MAAEKKTYFFIDILRGIGFLSVFLCHFLTAAYGVGAGRILGDGLTRFTEDVMGGSGIAVSVFFMVSGFCLAKLPGEKIRPGEFYRKRFFRLLLPFYVVVAGFILLTWLTEKSFSSVLNASAPRYTLLFSLLGMDGLLSVRGYTPFTFVYIGEWFLGILTLLYLIAPLLIFLMQRYDRLVMLLLTAVTAFFFVFRPFGGVNAASLLPNLFLFTLGMHLKYHEERITYRTSAPAFAAGAGMFLLAAFRVRAGLPQDALRLPKVMLMGIALFLLVECLEPKFSAKKALLKPLRVIRDYSFEFFLLHHGILNRVVAFSAKKSGGQLSTATLLLSLFVSFFVTAAGAFVLHRVCGLRKLIRLSRSSSEC